MLGLHSSVNVAVTFASCNVHVHIFGQDVKCGVTIRRTFSQCLLKKGAYVIIIPGSESSCLVFQFMSVSVPEAAKITFWFVIVYIDAVNVAVVHLGSMFQVFLRTRLLTLYKLFHESLTDLVVSFSVFPWLYLCRL